MQGAGAEVPAGEVADLLPGQEREELPRLLLLAGRIVSAGEEGAPPAASRNVSLSQSGKNDHKDAAADGSMNLYTAAISAE